jgi:FMN phosphatase YigB (HAD superfamily)
MIEKPQLILDIGGVLVTNLSPLFWQKLSISAAISSEILNAKFKQEIRESLWSGKINEKEFWSWLLTEFPSINLENAYAILQSNLKRLPAMDHLARWSEFADIHLLSNHRYEWIMPIFKSVEKTIKTITISSKVGFCKPDSRIFELVTQQMKKAETLILFVDDQNKNLQQGAKLGWKTILADTQSDWIDEVIPLLKH